MEWRIGIEQILDTVLRVPSLFIIDSILKGTFLWPWAPNETQIWDTKILLWMVFNLCGIFSALGIFVLNTSALITSHKFLAAGANLFFSYYFNMWFISEELKKEEYTEDLRTIITAPPYNFIVNLLIQLTISLAYNYFQLDVPGTHTSLGCSATLIGKVRAYAFPILLLPLLFRTMSVSPEFLQKTPLFTCLIMSLELKLILFRSMSIVFGIIKNSYISVRIMIRNFGIQSFIEVHWARLHIPNVLRLFWLVRTLYILSYVCTYYMYGSDEKFKVIFEYTKIQNVSTEYDTNFLNASNNISANVINEDKPVIISLAIVGQETLTLSCDTVVALMGMTSILSKLAHCLGLVLAWYVQSNNEEDHSLGTMTAILFFILALQTGLTSMHPAKRLTRLHRNFCLLFTAVLHFVHGMVNPILMNLSASQHHHLEKHVRPLSMCLFLVTFPVFFLYFLWQDNTTSTWLLAVTAFSVEVVIKVFVSLLVYTLFMIDAYREVFWEKLDDYVYYVKACGNSIEFLFGIFLFCNGAWIMVFESGGTIRAVMMCIHAYFNIWVQAREGWKTFMKRRTAAKKINSLPEASQEQLQNLNDVCAICYQELTSARVTRCNHYFHGVCLRKWLYMQGVCPMCHEEIYEHRQPVESAVNNDGMPQNNVGLGGANGELLHEHVD